MSSKLSTRIIESTRRLRSKITEITHSRRFYYLFPLFCLSSVLIIVASRLDKLHWLNWAIIQAIVSSIFSAVIFFILFNIIYPKFEDWDKQRGTISNFYRKEFIDTIRTRKTIREQSIVIIMETWTNLLLDDDDLGKRLEEAIIERIERDDKFSIQILLLNPGKEDLIKRRQEQLASTGIKASDIENNIYLNLRKLQNIRTKLQLKQDRLQVKLYNEPPSFAVYAHDIDLYLTFFKPGIQTTSDKFIKLYRDSDLSNFFIDTFETIWKQTTLNIEDILYLKVEVHGGESPQNFENVKYIYFNEEQRYYLQDSDLYERIFSSTLPEIQSISIIDPVIDRDHPISHRFNYESFTRKRLNPRIRELFESKYLPSELGQLFIGTNRID